MRMNEKLELKQHGRAYKLLNSALKNPYVLIPPAEIIALGTTSGDDDLPHVLRHLPQLP